MLSSANSFLPHGTALFALSVTSIAIGYYIGRRSSPSIQKIDAADNQLEDDEHEPDDGDLASIKAGLLEPCKLVLVVRTDLNMTPGKISAQCGHATLACYRTLIKRNPRLVKHWERTGQAKIALKATSEKQLLELEALAKRSNLCARSIQDAGRTQIEAGSRTVLGIGPAPVELINRVTGRYCAAIIQIGSAAEGWNLRKLKRNDADRAELT